MTKRIAILLLALFAIVRAQIPSLGFCPDYVPMTDFDMERFAGVWYEAERYFQLSEVVSRCVMSNYTKGSDGKYRVSNEVTSRLTGIKRILEGEIRMPAKKDEGKLYVKYTSVPLITPETSYSILETDYDNYAVLWSCAGIGPLHTQNAWIMTRERLVPGEVLQKAYAVLDKYKISKFYFVKTNQEDCAYLDSLSTPVKKPTRKPAKPEYEQYDEPAREVEEPLRTGNIVPDVPEIIRKVKAAEEEAAAAAAAAAASVLPTVADTHEAEKKIEEKAAVAAVVVPEEAGKTVESSPIEEAKTVPEVIMQVAEKASENVEPVGKNAVDAVEEPKKEEPVIDAVVALKHEEEVKVEDVKPVEA